MPIKHFGQERMAILHLFSSHWCLDSRIRGISRELAFTGGESRRLRLEHHHHHHHRQQQQQHQMGRTSGPGRIRRIYLLRDSQPHSHLWWIHACPPTLQLSEQWETARSIHNHISTSYPVSFAHRCVQAPPLRSASAATQRQRTAEREQPLRCHARPPTIAYFTHVRTHAV